MKLAIVVTLMAVSGILGIAADKETFLVNVDPEGYTIRMATDYLRIEDMLNYDVKVDINLQKVGKLTFIDFINPQKGFPWIPAGKTKLLAIYDEGNLVLYDKDKAAPAFAISGNKATGDGDRFTYSASSFLREGVTSYAADNIGKMKTASPWAEGVKGPGIGETITIVSKEENGKLFGLYLSNGFISYSKPYLFEQNNRLKTISVDSGDGVHLGDYDLEDIPNIQGIFWDKPVSKVVLKITSVYQGSKYDDTCLAFVMPVGF